MSNLIAKIPDPMPQAKKTLILAHRTELLDQAQTQIKQYNPSWRVVVDQGKRKPDIDDADVIVASVQTLGRKDSRRLERYDPQLFKTIMIDEVHHAAASTYIKILEHFDAPSDNKNHMFVWGCSATVRRHDGIALEGIFDKIVYHMDLLQMIEAGWLSPIKVTTIQTAVDLTHVGTRYDDFQQSQLARAVNVEHRNKIIFQSWQKFALGQERKSTLVFAVDIEHTLTLCNLFRDHGVNADFVTSKTPALTRSETLRKFRNGEIPVLVNCGILTEGTDIPRIDCVLMARPTKSSVLFQQMFGRGMRLYPEKKDCLVIDFVDNFSKASSEGLITFPTLMGLDHSQIVRDENVLDMERRAVAQTNLEHVVLPGNNNNEEQEEQQNDQIGQEIRIKITEYDDLNEFMLETSVSPELRSISANSWVTVGEDKCALNIWTVGTLKLELSKEDGLWRGILTREMTTATRGNAGDSGGNKPRMIFRNKKLPLKADTRSMAIRAADTWLKQNIPKHQQSMALRMASFRKHTATEAQLKALKHHKVESKQTLTKGQAMDLITRLKLGQRKIWQQERQRLLNYRKKQERAILRRKS
ncbi:P-loop containing nucleoside triphosphate hydrolase protein [Phascolomyces articulosus]|uniref:P-loop containing nucleoside triphosphate hydrolase protein n=1 Tax=Phascolomyces articulosus TaxID=60185 RepID=A0AAD5K191_9FUNG|nr:P-loop containing nucleoside triphosphate hydrolase protein [Phascolomyces articulosus]